MNISMHHLDANQRQVGLLRFNTDSVSNMKSALLKLSGRNSGENPNEREILHVYAVSNNEWSEDVDRKWINAPGVGKYHRTENEIDSPSGTADGTGKIIDIEDNYAGFTNGPGTGLGVYGEFIGAVSFYSSEYKDNYLDVSDYLKSISNEDVSVDVTFVVVRIVRYNVNEYENNYYTLGDYHYDGRVVEIATKENSDPELQPMLIFSGVK